MNVVYKYSLLELINKEIAKTKKLLVGQTHKRNTAAGAMESHRDAVQRQDAEQMLDSLAQKLVELEQDLKLITQSTFDGQPFGRMFNHEGKNFVIVPAFGGAKLAGDVYTITPESPLAKLVLKVRRGVY